MLIKTGVSLKAPVVRTALWAIYSHWSTTASGQFDLLYCAVASSAGGVGIWLVAVVRISLSNVGAGTKQTFNPGASRRTASARATHSSATLISMPSFFFAMVSA